MNEHEKSLEEHRLAFKVIGILTTLEECISKLKNGFLNTSDFKETRKTIKRLRIEALQIDLDIEEILDK